MYREYHQMQLDVMGLGKTEEEAKADMEKYMMEYLKQALDVIEDIPEAKNRLNAFFDLQSSDKDEDVGEFIPPEEEEDQEE